MIKTDFSNCLTAAADVQIPFFDLDPAGVAWHGRYFQYFELARCKLFEGFHYSYAEMEDSGILWPVGDTEVRYVRPLLLNHEVCVTACLREWEFRLLVDYKIEDADGVLNPPRGNGDDIWAIGVRVTIQLYRPPVCEGVGQARQAAMGLHAGDAGEVRTRCVRPG